MDPELIVRKFEGMVINLAKRHFCGKPDFEDLVQEGMLGLLEANNRYDPSKGTKFSTYAYYWIEKRILAALELELSFQKRTSAMEIEDKVDTNTDVELVQEGLYLPESIPEIERKILMLCYSQSYSIKEIAQILQLSTERVKQLRGKALRRLRALHKQQDSRS
ncbi:MAG: sigma-70 family RNA polymerase sigma factor [Candidatus Cloacimonetes bacterium]|jgi:RNA polymerase sigma factor (sigma-70 family)|nr:sigma-70 family RNA polymerase sigma factor [Candidatus Cloacimonadota bacterium]MDD2507140.1 sigma-70 family RNA polymerase sigma factor [Candidatus Cloacimonadota bacterium]MDD4560657.1 sigma-70 family RNA polymerase sigma factor [Candidatus Cloacimonadota bacterium]